jgi:Na+-translocating ferredoxin:NAD+ oxidoreductase RnfD subunit
MSGQSHEHNSTRHLVLMVLCCLVPLAAIAALAFFGVSSGLLYFGVMLLCPAMHFLMMGNHSRHGKAESAGGDAKPSS